jgi:hypothetical protein
MHLTRYKLNGSKIVFDKTDHMTDFYVYCCEMTNRCVKDLVDFINVFQIFYPDMFRQLVAIFRGS